MYVVKRAARLSNRDLRACNGYMLPRLKNPILFLFKNDSLNTTSTQYLTEGKSVSSTGFLLEFKEFC